MTATNDPTVGTTRIPATDEPAVTAACHRRPSSWHEPRRVRRPKSVRWLSLVQLTRTARLVYRSSQFATYADKREVMATAPAATYDFTTKDDKLTVDFMADTGDGFAATLAVAQMLSEGPSSSGENRLTGNADRRGVDPADLLLLGGDEVYPTASAAAYGQRLLTPFNIAPRLGGGVPQCETCGRWHEPSDTGTPSPMAAVLAIPGNHDWYDGLVAFRRVFCEGWVMWSPRATEAAGTTATSGVVAWLRQLVAWIRSATGMAESEVQGAEASATPVDQVPEPAYRTVLQTDDDATLANPPPRPADQFAGRWEAPQTRSYYAATISKYWAVWGVDTQLNRELDAAQLAYFIEAARSLGDRRLVVCVATPSWMECQRNGVDHWAQDEPPGTPWFTIVWLLQRALGGPDGPDVPDRSDRWLTTVAVLITGDVHHYARLTPRSAIGPQLVTCGGGGAYTSSTHHVPAHLDLVTNPVVARGTEPVAYELGHSLEPGAGAGAALFPAAGKSRRYFSRSLLATPVRNGWSWPSTVAALGFGLASLAEAGDRNCVLAAGLLIALFAAWGGTSGAKGRAGMARILATLGLAVAGLVAMALAIEVWMLTDFDIEAPDGTGRGAVGVAATGVFIVVLALRHHRGDGVPPGPSLLLAVIVGAIATGFCFPAVGIRALAAMVLFNAAVSLYLIAADQFGLHELEASSAARSQRFKSITRMTFDGPTLTLDAWGLDKLPGRTGDRPHPKLVDSWSCSAERP